MTTERLAPVLLAALLGLSAGAVAAASPPARDPAEDQAMADIGYLQLHPDVEYRQLGLQSYKRGHLQTAAERFRRAGYFGDKPSQGLLAEMYWKGEGVPADRALAYVWMDMAAERGYRDLAILRERYWAAMTAPEHERALREGPPLYAVYGDPAVKPRYQRHLTRQRNQITGSHIGVDVGVGASAGNEGGFQGQSKIGGFYESSNWNAEQYWQRQDRFWQSRLGGSVSVGEIEKLGEGEPGAEPAAAEGAAPAAKPAAPAPPASAPESAKPPRPR